MTDVQRLQKAERNAAIPANVEQSGPALDTLVQEIIGRVADKWTMLALEVLTEHGRLRFARLGELIGGVSQKMLTKTLRQMEADGLVTRTVYPVVPPRVEYELTEMGLGLSEAFCGVWMWAEKYQANIYSAREQYRVQVADAQAAGEGKSEWPPLQTDSG